MPRPPFPPVLAALALLAAAASPLAAALAEPPHVDIRFLSEHLPEAAQDARAHALPWPDSAPAPGRWRPFAAAGWSSARVDFLEESGWLASAGAQRGFERDRALVLFGFYDAFAVGGGPGEQVLSADFLAESPLDLPERARFSDPRGDFRHYGVGAAWSWRVSPPGARRPWRAEAGLLVDRLTLDGYELDYELLGGADAGARGVLDQSSEATFATPFVGIGCTLPLGSAFALVPRALGGVPLPEGTSTAGSPGRASISPARIRAAARGGSATASSPSRSACCTRRAGSSSISAAPSSTRSSKPRPTTASTAPRSST